MQAHYSYIRKNVVNLACKAKWRFAVSSHLFNRYIIGIRLNYNNSSADGGNDHCMELRACDSIFKLTSARGVKLAYYHIIENAAGSAFINRWTTVDITGTNRPQRELTSRDSIKKRIIIAFVIDTSTEMLHIEKVWCRWCKNRYIISLLWKPQDHFSWEKLIFQPRELFSLIMKITIIEYYGEACWTEADLQDWRCAEHTVSFWSKENRDFVV